MGTALYSMIRGRVIRITELNACGRVSPGARWVVTAGVASVKIEEKTYSHSGGAQVSELTDEIRLVEPDWEETIGYFADIALLGVDADIIDMVSGNPSLTSENGDIIGIDVQGGGGQRTFAMEIWTKLSGPGCTGKWGYTLFPRLWGGRLAGHEVGNGLINVDLVGAQCLRGARWTGGSIEGGFGIGPFSAGPFGGDDDPDHHTPVGIEDSHNRFWLNAITDGHPSPGRYNGTIAPENLGPNSPVYGSWESDAEIYAAQAAQSAVEAALAATEAEESAEEAALAATEAEESAEDAQAAHPFLEYDEIDGWPARPVEATGPVGWVDPTGLAPYPPDAQPGDLYFPSS